MVRRRRSICHPSPFCPLAAAATPPPGHETRATVFNETIETLSYYINYYSIVPFMHHNTSNVPGPRRILSVQDSSSQLDSDLHYIPRNFIYRYSASGDFTLYNNCYFNSEFLHYYKRRNRARLVVIRRVSLCTRSSVYNMICAAQ